MSGNLIKPAQWSVVTGASSGIGLEFSRQLAAMGSNLVMISNQPHELEDEARKIASASGIIVLPLEVDLTAADAEDKILAFLRSNGIMPYLLVHNAGIFDFRAVGELSSERIDVYIDLHIRAVTRLSRSIGALMAGNGGGRILNMSSMPMPGIAMYSATKAYIRAFSRAYRIEMKDCGVSVTVACPGGIATNLFGLPPQLQRLGVSLGVLMTPQAFVRRALKRTFRGKAQYINGLLNRVSIVFVASLPEWARSGIKHRLLDKMNRQK